MPWLKNEDLEKIRGDLRHRFRKNFKISVRRPDDRKSWKEMTISIMEGSEDLSSLTGPAGYVEVDTADLQKYHKYSSHFQEIVDIVQASSRRATSIQSLYNLEIGTRARAYTRNTAKYRRLSMTSGDPTATNAEMRKLMENLRQRGFDNLEKDDGSKIWYLLSLEGIALAVWNGNDPKDPEFHGPATVSLALIGDGNRIITKMDDMSAKFADRRIGELVSLSENMRFSAADSPATDDVLRFSQDESLYVQLVKSELIDTPQFVVRKLHQTDEGRLRSEEICVQSGLYDAYEFLVDLVSEPPAPRGMG